MQDSFQMAAGENPAEVDVRVSWNSHNPALYTADQHKRLQGEADYSLPSLHFGMTLNYRLP